MANIVTHIRRAHPQGIITRVSPGSRVRVKRSILQGLQDTGLVGSSDALGAGCCTGGFGPRPPLDFGPPSCPPGFSRDRNTGACVDERG